MDFESFLKKEISERDINMVFQHKILGKMPIIQNLNKFCIDLQNAKTCPRSFRSAYFKDKRYMVETVRNMIIQCGVPVQEVEQLKWINVATKDWMDANEVAPILNPLTGKIYFFSVVLDKVVPICTEKFKKLYGMKELDFREVTTPVPLTFDESLPPGLTDDGINCRDISPFIF